MTINMLSDFFHNVFTAQKEPQKELGALLAQIRKTRKVARTQQQIADALSIGRARLGHYEAGRRLPGDDFLEAFSEIHSYSRGDQKELFRRLRLAVLCVRVPKTRQLFPEHFFFEHSARILPQSLVSEITDRRKRLGLEETDIVSQLDISFDSFGFILMRKEGCSAELLVRLADVLGAEPDQWLMKAGHFTNEQWAEIQNLPETALNSLPQTIDQCLARLASD